MQITFDDIEINTKQYELYCAGKLISIEPLIFELLVHFAKNPDRIFNRDELTDAVWTGRIVSDSTISSAVKNLRQAIGDNGKEQRYLKTVHGRGFRFVAKTNVLDTVSEQPAKISSTLSNAVSSEPSLIILPFKVFSGDQKLCDIAEELVSDLESILARVPLLKMNTQASRYNVNDLPSLEKIYQDTNVKYIIKGSIKLLDDQFKVNVKLSDAVNNHQLWSEKFSCDDAELLATNIIAKLEPQLNRAIFNQVEGKSAQPTARELYLKASSLLAHKGWHSNTFTEAVVLLQESEKLDSSFALTPASLSLILALGHRVGLITDRDKTVVEVIRAAEQSLILDNMDSTVLGFVGCAFADIGMITRAVPILKNALQINSTNAQAWVALGSAYVLDKKYEEGIKYLVHGIDISPLDSRLSIWGTALALAYLNVGNVELAHEQAELACQRDDNSYFSRVGLAAIYLYQRKIEAARDSLTEAYRVKPDLSTDEIKAIAGKILTRQLLRIYN